MRIMVTGGAGFIGSNFVRRLLDGCYPEYFGAEVIILDKMTYAGNLSNLAPVSGRRELDVVEGDICDADLVARLMENIDLVVHFAAESHVDRSISGSLPFTRTNVLGTHTLLQAALDAGVGRFLHVSTDEVYGSIRTGSWDENCSLAPNSPYAASKAASDLLALSFHRTHGLNVSITRSSNNYGPYQYPEKLLPRFVSNLMDGTRIPLYGDGLNTRDWLHVDDHCRALALVAGAGGPGEVYNIGGGNELTNIEITERLLELCDADWGSVNRVEDRKAHDWRYSVDTKKISERLGFAPRVHFSHGLPDTVDWYAKNRSWWEPLKKQIPETTP